MGEVHYLVILIAVFSVVQSIFGVVLLLFGTPTLLLLEHSYAETLWLLLPCSVAISFIQVVNNYKLIEAKKRAIYLVIPSLVLGSVEMINLIIKQYNRWTTKSSFKEIIFQDGSS